MSLTYRRTEPFNHNSHFLYRHHSVERAFETIKKEEKQLLFIVFLWNKYRKQRESNIKAFSKSSTITILKEDVCQDIIPYRIVLKITQ